MDVGKRAIRDFGKRVREIRLAKGWTQEELAHRLSLNSTFVSRLERGERSPSLPTIARIAQALEVHVSFLFEGWRSSQLAGDKAQSAGSISNPTMVNQTGANPDGTGVAEE